MTNQEKYGHLPSSELFELVEDGELCNCCPLPKEVQGVHCYGGEPVMCEGKCCGDALEYWLEQEADSKEEG